MRIPRRGLQFDRITYHERVTQCLGSLTTEPWYLVVAEPTGSLQRPPSPDDLHAFRVGHASAIDLFCASLPLGCLMRYQPLEAHCVRCCVVPKDDLVRRYLTGSS